MSTANDFVPAREGPYDAWQEQFVAYAASNMAALGLSAADISALTSAQADWASAAPAYQSALLVVRAASESKRAARKALTGAIRRVAAKVRANPAANEQLKRGLGLSGPKPRTRVRPPNSHPQLIASTGQRLEITLQWTDSASGRKARPEGVVGIELFLKIAGDPPRDAEECRMVGFKPSSPTRVQFDGADAGKAAHFMARWVNRRGEAGPLGETVTATIAL